MLKLLVVGFGIASLYAGSIDYTVSINPNDLTTDIINSFDYVCLPGYSHMTEIGHPALPIQYLSFIMPPDATVERVEILSEKGLYLAGTYSIYPAQKPMPVSVSVHDDVTQPDRKIYSANELYPKAALWYVHEGTLSGYRIASVAVVPLRYNPVIRRLYCVTQLTFRIHYTHGAVVQPITEAQKALARERVTNIVKNRDKVEAWAPPSRKGIWDSEYIIITDTAFVDDFQRLKVWKTRKGVPTEIVTTTWIYANYSGVDNPTKIRNFIKAARDSGALYFMLAGQCDGEHSENYVPRRDVFCMRSYGGAYPDEDTIPCDIYFSDLDGTWNGNGNSIYGEMGDGVNLYSDVYVGRGPVKNGTQIDNFISKVITYETAPSLSFANKALLLVGNLWSGNHGNGINDTIADTIPNDWQKSKLYEDYGLMSRYIERDSLNRGFNLCSMVGHGNEDGVYYNYGTNPYYYTDDVATQTNDSTNSAIAMSMGCFLGAVDESGAGSGYDCVAERMVVVNKKCATATIMNTRYGWGYSGPQGNILLSGEFCVWFFRKLFGTAAYHCAQVLSAARDQMVPQAISDSYYRWCFYVFNLFGDPEMPIWTDTPRNMAVSYSSDTIASYGDGYTDTFTVAVEDAALRAPIQNALVTIMQDSTVYERQYTNGSGQAVFIFPDNTFQTEGYAWVTVTQYSDNYLPDLDSAFVASGIVTVEESSPSPQTFNVVVSPNPMTHNLFLNLGAPVVHEVVVSLYNIEGSCVQSLILTRGVREAVIATKSLSNGVYFLKTEGDVAVDKKIIIVR